MITETTFWARAYTVRGIDLEANQEQECPNLAIARQEGERLWAMGMFDCVQVEEDEIINNVRVTKIISSLGRCTDDIEPAPGPAQAD